MLGVYQEEFNACTLYRLTQPYTYAKKAGYNFNWLRLRDIEQVEGKHFDVIVLQRLIFKPEHLDTNMLTIAQDLGRESALVYETDDDILNVPESNPAYLSYQPQRQALSDFLGHVDAITCTGPGLAKTMREYNSKVWQLPNYWDPTFWRQGIRLRSDYGIPADALVIGTQGSYTHSEDWKIVEEPLKRIAEKYPDVHFLFAGYLPEYLEDLPNLHFAPWYEIKDHPAMTKLFDIGLCPLVDNQFNRGKSPIKALEFMMAKVPFVASPLQYEAVTKHDNTGYIARNTEDWFKYLDILVRSQSVRKRFAESGYRYVTERFNIQKEYMKWVDAYHMIYLAKQRDSRSSNGNEPDIKVA